MNGIGAPGPAGDIGELLARMGREPSSWLGGDAPHAGIVLSSRVRLARNLEDAPFGVRATEEQRERVASEVLAAAPATPSLARCAYFDLPRLSEGDRRLLYERHLISREHAGERGSRGVFVSPDETVSVLVNEEDHLRIQGIAAGYDLDRAWNEVSQVDDELGEILTYAFSARWGFLTACPTNVGTGMRASLLIHLPALVLTKQIGKILHGIMQVGLAVRGLHGEGTEVMGNFFQISNQTTLGRSERDILESLSRVTQQLIEHENQAGAVLLRDARLEVEDKVYRARALLRACRVISAEEVMGLASALRLGVHLGLVGDVGLGTLNRVLVFSQPAHVERSLGPGAPAVARDIRRADVVRGLMGGGT